MNKPTILLHDGTELARRLEQSVTVLIGLFVFLNPFPHMTALKEITFYSSVLTGIIFVGTGKKDFVLRTPFTIPFLLFLVWAVVGIFFSMNKPNTINDIYAHCIKYFVFFYLLINFFQSEKHLQLLAWIITVSVTIHSIGAMIYFYPVLGHSISERLGHGSIYSFSEIPTDYMAFSIIFSLLLCLGLFRKDLSVLLKAILLICAPILLAATILTQSRGALIALVISLLLLAIRKRKIVIVFAFCLFIAFMLNAGGKERWASANIFFKNERITTYYMFWEIIKDHPLTGIGFGMQTYDNEAFLNAYHERVPDEIRKFRPQDPIRSPHNLLIDVAVRTGLIGLTVFIIILGIFIKTCWHLVRQGQSDFMKDWGLAVFASFAAFMVQSMFADAAFGSQAIVFYSILAMMTILWRLDEDSPDPSMAHGT